MNKNRSYPQMGQIWKHIKNERKYTVLRLVRMKNPKTRRWDVAVLYKNDIDVFVREATDFLDRFQLQNSTL